MRIALIGYGKMGKAIEQIALSRGHEISVAANNAEERSQITADNTDVAIEFTSPESAFDNLLWCMQHNIPAVSGSTGWLDRFDDIKIQCEQHKGAFFYASNFSVGVNLFFKVNEVLARLMNPQDQYEVSMEEVHHTEKKDAPSGTAITLAEGIIDQLDRKSKWVKEKASADDEIAISSKRIDKTPGTHTITYRSSVDSIDITHTAHSREGFAMGAMLAAEWLVGKTGVFGMNDMLKL